MSKFPQVHDKASQVSELLKLMAHTDRMVVLCLLSNGEMGVTELREHTKLSQSAFSQHLAVLRKNQLVKVRKASQQVYYSISDPRVSLLINSLQQSFCPFEEDFLSDYSNSHK